MLELTLLLWYEDKARGGGRGSRDKGDTRYCYLLPVQEKKQTNPHMLPWLVLFQVISPGCTAFNMLADGGPEQKLTLK